MARRPSWLLGLYRDAYRGLPPEVWRLSVVAFINRSGTMVVPFLSLWLTGERGYTTGEAGLFLALYGLGALTGTYLGGLASDRFPPRRVQVASLALTGVLFFALGFTQGTIAIALVLTAVAAVGEAFRPANSTSLTFWAPFAVRNRSFALRRLAVNLGMTFGPAVGGFLALRSYGWLFLADGATCLLAAVALLRLLPDEALPRDDPPDSDEPPELSPWRDGPFLVYLGLVILITMLIFQFASTWPLTLRDLYGLAENRIGLLIAINTLLIVAFEMVMIHAIQRFRPLRVMAVGSLLVGGGLALLPFGSSFLFAAGTVVVWTVGEMLTFPLTEPVATARAGRRNPGRYLGLLATAFGLSFAVAQLIGPWVYQTWGPKILWLGAGGVGALAAAGLLLLAPRLTLRTSD